MKNILLILLTVFILTGCSKDDENNGIITDKNEDTSTKAPLLKQTISTMGGVQTVTDYHYLEGNKVLQAVSNNGTKIVWTYEDKLITEQKYYENDELKTKETYKYNSQEKMVQRIAYYYTVNQGYKTEYIYNSDSTVTVLGYKGDLDTQTNLDINNKVYLFSNGDVQKIEFNVEVGGVSHVRTRVYTYDDKNTPTNGILNFNKIKMWETGTYGNIHNNLSIVYTTTENSSSSSTEEVIYTYNSKGTPETSSAYDGNLKSQYFYE